MKIFLLALTLVTTVTAVNAHDFWIEPSTYRPAPGSMITLRLRVGEHLNGDPVPRKPNSQLKRFEAHTTTGIVPVTGSENSDPAGELKLNNKGLVLIAYHNTPGYVELADDRVEVYLKQEGFEKLLEQWRKDTDRDFLWRENYSRCAKALLWTGSGAATLFDKNLGLPLEIIPRKNPYKMKQNGTLPFQVLYLGKPLADLLVVAIPKIDPRKTISRRTDRQGRVEFKLPYAGEWLIKAVHLVPAPRGRAAWESFWASLTFELPK